MTQSFFKNSSCWFEHMQLHMKTRMDPEDSAIRLRAAEGLEAVDFFMPGYHVWAKLIESLGDLGYDSNNLVSPQCGPALVSPANCGSMLIPCQEATCGVSMEFSG